MAFFVFQSPGLLDQDFPFIQRKENTVGRKLRQGRKQKHTHSVIDLEFIHSITPNGHLIGAGPRKCTGSKDQAG